MDVELFAVGSLGIICCLFLALIMILDSRITKLESEARARRFGSWN